MESTAKRRKKLKQHKIKTVQQRNKNNAHKRKIQLTQEFERTEREVLELLENASLLSDSSNNASRDGSKSPSESFFCGDGDEEQRRFPDIKNNFVQTFEEAGSKASQEQDEVVSKQSTEDLSSTNRSQQPTLASTFIQIDETSPDNLVRLECLQHKWDANALLYWPSKTMEVNLLYAKEGKMPANLQIMLNRFYIEAKYCKITVNPKVVDALKNSMEQLHQYNDKVACKTICDFKFKPIFLEPSTNNMEIPSKKLLSLHIKELSFTEHPELREEHKLANSLELLCEHRSQRLKEKITEKLFADLQVERNVLDQLLANEEMSARTDSKERQRKALQIEHHLFKVKALREKLYDEEQCNKQLLKDILQNWMKLKKLRKEQTQHFTRLKIRITVEDVNQLELIKRNRLWEERFNTDLNEIYREKLEEFYRTKRLWLLERAEGESIMPRPRKPDINKLSCQLKDNFVKCFPDPMEPRLNIVRTYADDPQYAEQPGPRKLRSYSLRIFLDRQMVGETRYYRLERDLKVNINEKFSIVLNRRLPRDITIKLYKKSKITSHQKIANIIVPLPLPAINVQETQNFNIDFSSHKLPITGYLRLDLHSDDQIYPSDVVDRLFPRPKDHTTIPKSILQEWCENKLLNAGEMRNLEESSQLMNAVSDSEDEEQRGKESTCTFEEDLLRFCDVKELDINRRFRVLRSRYMKNDSRTKDMKCVPMLDYELEFDGETEEAVIDTGDWLDPIDLHKHEGKKYLRNLYEAIRNQCSRMTKVVSSRENLLLNDEPMSWSAFFHTLRLIFQPRLIANVPRNLSIASSVQTLSLDTMQNFRIVCNIARVTGIPVRISNSGANESKSKNQSPESSNVFVLQNLKYSNVRPFIALSYKDKFCRTMTAEGSNPTWNEELIIQLSGNLSDLREDIKICLYDEFVENQLNDDVNMKNADVYQRIQNNWLGEYRIPITSLLMQKKMDAVFEMNTPRLLVGYKRPALDKIGYDGDTSITIEQLPEIKESVRLWCLISMEPIVELPALQTKCLECSELSDIRQHLADWCLEAYEVNPGKFLDPLVCTSEGKRMCMTRLLQPLAPPMEASENLLDSVCRYVSLLVSPKLYDPCSRLNGIWLSNEVLLDTTWGSFKDLGILLCNYLLHLGLQCWLVLGVSYPQGECTFVLYKTEESEMFYIDPISGKRYGVKDVFCPLQEIKMVLTTTNFYLNIQSESRVSMLNLNFNDGSCWLPGFPKRNPGPSGGFHITNYKYRDTFSIAELRYNIERKIMKKISSWRTMRKTLWNRAFQPRLLNILQAMEEGVTFGNGSSYEELKYNDMLAEEFPHYKIYGFTLNYSYTNLNQITERIKSTGIHLNSSKDVEFSVAVHIHPYPGNVLSVWIFLITIVPL